MARVSDSPQRRTYRTGGTLPALETSFRPIPLGRDETGEPDGAVRAFAVLIRNRADSSIFIQEGPDADDEFEISRGEDFKIWEPNGVNAVTLRGTNGGETAEIRALEAHNDFNIRDKVDAALRSLSHFVQTATRDTQITGQDIDLTIDDAGGISVVGDVDASIVNDVLDVRGDVNANIVNSTLDVDATGSVIDAEITNSVLDIQGGVDIEAQSVGDISVQDIEGSPRMRFLNDENADAGQVEHWTWGPAPTDGFITSVHNRTYHSGTQTMTDGDKIAVYVEIDRGDGSGFVTVTPRFVASARRLWFYGRQSNAGSVHRYAPGREVSWTWEPNIPVKFREGDNIRIRFSSDSLFDIPSDGYGIECQINYIIRD